MDQELIKVALSAAGGATAAVAVVFRYALKAKLREAIEAVTEPRFTVIHRILDRKVDTEDLQAMELRVTDRHEELLAALERNTGAIAKSLHDLTKSVTLQGREVSELRGAFDAAGAIVHERRGHGRRRTDLPSDDDE